MMMPSWNVNCPHCTCFAKFIRLIGIDTSISDDNEYQRLARWLCGLCKHSWTTTLFEEGVSYE